MRLLEGLAELLFPTRCAGCEMPGALLCDTCRDALPLIDRRGHCPRCGAPFGYLTCTECWNREWAFEAALALGEFEPPLARAVVLHKDAGERRLAAVLGGLLGNEVSDAWDGWADAVAFVPATRAALRRRGFDHGFAIANALADNQGIPLLRALHRAAALDQRTLGRAARAPPPPRALSPWCPRPARWTRRARRVWTFAHATARARATVKAVKREITT